MVEECYMFCLRKAPCAASPQDFNRHLFSHPTVIAYDAMLDFFYLVGIEIYKYFSIVYVKKGRFYYQMCQIIGYGHKWKSGMHCETQTMASQIA